MMHELYDVVVEKTNKEYKNMMESVYGNYSSIIPYCNSRGLLSSFTCKSYLETANYNVTGSV